MNKRSQRRREVALENRKKNAEQYTKGSDVFAPNILAAKLEKAKKEIAILEEKLSGLTRIS